MKNTKRMLLLALALGLGGCVTAYEEPKSGPIATLVFSTDVVIRKVSPPVQAALFMEPADCTEVRFLGGVEPGKDVRVRVAADRELATMMGYTEQQSYNQNTRIYTVEDCSVVISFRPAENHVYQFAFQRSEGKCYIDARDLGRGGAGPGVRFKVDRRIKRADVKLVSDPHCLRLAAP